MLSAFVKGLEQLADPAVRRVLWTSIGLAVLSFLLIWIAVGFLLGETTLFQTGWLDTVVDVLGGFATVALTWLLFPAVVGTMSGFLLEGIADAVERCHYPQLPPARNQPLEEVILSSLKFFGVLLGLNLVALLFLIVPPLFPFVFYGVNGYLLGREYFDLVAARRLDPETVRRLRRRHGRTVFAAGIVVALLLTIPGVNLLAPLIGLAAMVHLFHRFRSTPEGGATVP